MPLTPKGLGFNAVTPSSPSLVTISDARVRTSFSSYAHNEVIFSLPIFCFHSPGFLEMG